MLRGQEAASGRPATHSERPADPPADGMSSKPAKEVAYKGRLSGLDSQWYFGKWT